MYDSEVMCRKEVDTPWSIYRDFTASHFLTSMRKHLIYLVKIRFTELQSPEKVVHT